MAMTLRVYRVTAAGERREVLPPVSVSGAEVARLGFRWPVCACPRCLTRPGAERVGSTPEIPPLAP